MASRGAEPAAGRRGGKGKIRNREELLTALRTASEIEHLLACQYLYSGFSVRRSLADFPPGSHEAESRVTLDRVKPWLSQLYLVARQEMEHLGIVCNLLAAVGEEPHFARADFPQPPRRSLLNAPLGLDRFSLTALRRFVWYERPDFMTPCFAAACCGLEDWEPEEGPEPAIYALEIRDIQQLYDEIEHAFATLPPAEIFVGNPERQLGNVFSFRVRMAVAANREEAKVAIHQIVSEGEGIGSNPLTSNSHFQRFTHVLTQMEHEVRINPTFDPALPVVTNPLTKPHAEGYPASVITRPETVAVMRFFNDCYQAMLVMLQTFFTTYSRSATPQPSGQSALFYAAFFPLMTAVIRPLGEVLARMPAGDEFPGQNAGASFELGEPVTTQTDPDWHHERMSRLVEQARDLREAVPERLRPMMNQLFEDLTSTAGHMRNIWTGA